jgi:acyl-CoA synthetase (AMP-forming)/AMP-acid ligase II
MNIRELIENRVKSNPNKIYLFFEDQKITYQDFDTNINMAANGFLRLGIRKGDHFAIMLPNSPEWLYAWFGLNKIGAVQTAVNIRLKGPELQYVLNHSDAKGIIISAGYYPLLDSIRSRIPRLKHIIVVGERIFNQTDVIQYRTWLEGLSEKLQPVALSEEDPAVLIYTSGTTGNPKGVLNSHGGWVLTGECTAHMTDVSPEDRIITPNPLFHTMAQCYAVMSSLAANASLVLLEKFSRSQLIEQTRRYGGSILILAAAATPMFWSRPPQDDDGDNPVRVMQAGYVPSDYYDDFEIRFQLKIQTAYSLTETTVAVMAPRRGTSPRKKTPGVGIVMEHPDPSFQNEVKIIDETGAAVPRGQHGQFIVKNSAVMIGYYKILRKLLKPNRTAGFIPATWDIRMKMGTFSLSAGVKMCCAEKESYFHQLRSNRSSMRIHRFKIRP